MITILRTIIWLLCTCIVSLLLVPLILILWVFRDRSEGSGPNRVLSAVMRPVLIFLSFIAGSKVIVIGGENIPETPALFVGNHQGYFDAIIAVCHLGEVKASLFKLQLMKVPVIGTCLKLLGGIAVDRDNIRQSFKSIQLAERKLESGHQVLIFPEGTRSRGDGMNPFKHGAFKAALDTKVPIVPFVIDGSYRCYEESGRIKPALVRVSVLPPISPEEFEGMKSAALSQLMEEKILSELTRLQNTAG